MSVIRCDIFCKVIDNYGDIGVCWRLARQLASEHGLAVRLWVDDMASFARLERRIDPQLTSQTVAGVEACHWDETAARAEPAELVIEAFACEPPEAYVAAMAARPRRPVWLNLEYLSAEDWVEGCHALPSPHPRLPLVKHFFFPGFSERTGGLIREAGLCDRLDAFRADAVAQNAFWRALVPGGVTTDLPKISLFGYENEAIAGLLEAWATGPDALFCAVAAGRHEAQVRSWLGTRGVPVEAGVARVGRLHLAFLPFLPQDDYDRLLAACDLNLVRGEDSFVRAQWAAHPLVWHIYRQEDGAHRVKLEAFLAPYLAGLSAAPARALGDFWQAWEEGGEAGTHWPALRAALPALQAHAAAWRGKLLTQPDLVSKLLIFSRNLLE